jgi:hypothetical protein
VESDHSGDAEHNEKREHNQLRKLEWLFGLRLHHGMKRRNFFKRLHDENEDVEIQRNHRTDDVDPAPGSGELPRITRVNCNRKHERRNDAELKSRRETMKRKEEAGHRRCYRSDEKPLRPTAETLAAKHTKHDDQAGEDCDKTDQCMNDCVDVQYHVLSISFIFACISRFVQGRAVEVDHMLGDFIDRGARALALTSLLPIVMDNSAEQSAESLSVPLHIELSKTAAARHPG